MAPWLANQRQGEPERGALPNRALDPDPPTVGLDDGLANVEPQPQAHPRAVPDRDPRDAREALPHMRLVGGRQARALVAHADARPRTVLLVCYFNVDRDRPPPLGILERVR